MSSTGVRQEMRARVELTTETQTKHLFLEQQGGHRAGQEGRALTGRQGAYPSAAMRLTRRDLSASPGSDSVLTAELRKRWTKARRRRIGAVAATQMRWQRLGSKWK